MKKLKQFYNDLSLTGKIRYSYIILIIPMVLSCAICFYNLWDGNRRYEDMVKAAVVASEFSLDFKKDFDYETYLLLVENKSIEESNLDEILEKASRVILDLEELTDSSENAERLKYAKKYLENLETYKARIESNLLEGNKYEDNLEIWENDVQIVTALLRESVLQYIYYEIKDMQLAHEEYQKVYLTAIEVIVILFIGVAVIIAVLSYYIPKSITSPISEISKITDKVTKGDLTVRSNIKAGAEVGVLSESLNAMIEKINELLQQTTKEQIRLRKAEFELLQSQINPHFLYNTLDTIVWLAEGGSQKQVVSMVKSLSEFFRVSLSQGEDVVYVREELQHVRSYLEIQHVRYRDMLEFEINVPESLYEYRIPKITIQPLVENALYHGVKNRRGLGKIEVNGRKEKEGFSISIIDNGIGMKEERLVQVLERIQNKIPGEKEAYGLYNVNERIRLKFGEAYGINIESIYGEGTKVTIKLPCEQNQI